MTDAIAEKGRAELIDAWDKVEKAGQDVEARLRPIRNIMVGYFDRFPDGPLGEDGRLVDACAAYKAWWRETEDVDLVMRAGVHFINLTKPFSQMVHDYIDAEDMERAAASAEIASPMSEVAELYMRFVDFLNKRN